INNFEFAKDDGDGRLVPRAAHIRKAYPRDEMTPTGGEADTQTHRLLRRGIPYGESFRDGAPTGSTAGADADRGLLFLGYQASLERQFEFVVSQWFNKPDHPERGDGHDPILSQSTRTKQFTLPGGSPVHLTMQRFVFTTGGAYLFQPSISALRRLSRPSAATNPAPPLPAPSPRSPPPPRPAPARPAVRAAPAWCSRVLLLAQSPGQLVAAHLRAAFEPAPAGDLDELGPCLRRLGAGPVALAHRRRPLAQGRACPLGHVRDRLLALGRADRFPHVALRGLPLLGRDHGTPPPVFRGTYPPTVVVTPRWPRPVARPRSRCRGPGGCGRRRS